MKNFIEKYFFENNISTIKQEGNLLVHIKGRDRSRAIIFNSHMDTVSAGDEKLWRYGAWSPTSEDKKIIGLGSSDMKSGLATSMLTATKFTNTKPPVDLWFTYVVKEEQDGSGTKSFTKWFTKKGYLKLYSKIAAIFTEPTGLSEIEIGHRGNIFISVSTKGNSGHASKPQNIKKHAVREMIKFSDKLALEMKNWQKEFKDNVFDPPTVGEITSIKAGDSPNKFPATCEATFDIRTTPNFHKVAISRIKLLGKKTGAKITLAFPPAPAGYTNPNKKIVKSAKKVLKKSQLTVSQGAADLGFLTNIGIESIIFGPGEKEQAHRTDEYCYPDQIPQAVNIYKAIVEAWAK